MSFTDEGFLATEAAATVERFRREHADWFELADRLNHMGMRLLATDADDAQQMLIRTLFGRAISNLQGAILMAERGMIAEAGILARACLETVFYQGATAKDKSFRKQLEVDAANHKKEMATRLLELPPEQQGLSADQLEQLQESAGETERADWIQMWAAAEKAGLVDLYRLVYAQLSHNAAHPKSGALEQYAVRDSSGAIIRMQWGPHPEGIADSLEAACIVFLQAILTADETLNNSSMASEVQECKERHDSLLSEMVEAQLEAERTTRNPT